MIRALLLALLALPIYSQSLTFVVHDPTGAQPDQPLSADYQFPDTMVGSSSDLVLRAYNSSNSPIEAVDIYISSSADFLVTGTFIDKVLSPNETNFEEFTVHFRPIAVQAASANLQITYLTQQGTCDFSSTDPNAQCPSTTATVAAFTGTGTTPQYTVTSTLSGTSSVIHSTDTINFGGVSVSASATATITIANQSSTALTTPAVAINAGVFASSAFAADTSTLPVAIGPNSSATFTIKFAPGQANLTTASLTIGTNTYALVGTGTIATSIDNLQIVYVDQTDVRTSPQAATPISFGQVTAGASQSATLSFFVTNPQTSLDPVTISTISVTGASFSFTGVPTLPVTVQPGQTITFSIAFTPSQTGQSTGLLSIGTRQFALSGIGADLALPNVSLVIDEAAVASQQQPHISVQLAAPSTITAVGTLTLAFTSAVTGIQDDSAILFLAGSNRTAPVTISPGATIGTFNGQSQLTFQTGTTAGTLKFSLQFPNKQAITKSIQIQPSVFVMTSSAALRQGQSLVVTIAGFDNTYSASKLTYSFSDLKGKLIKAVTYDLTSNFRDYFFSSANVTGGVVSIQASFPVVGDITQVGAVDISLVNSAGTSAVTHAQFQ